MTEPARVTVFLTGASSGIGRVLAEQLTAAGYRVWGTARARDRLPTRAGFHPVVLDLADPASIAAAVDTAQDEAGGFDVLINNAGAGWFGPVTDLPLAAVRDQFELLVFGPIDVIQRALPAMQTRPRPLVINVTSLAALFPIPFMAPYNASKAALASVSAALRLELAGTSVRVVELQCGDIHTPFQEHTRRLNPASASRQETAAWNAAVDHINRAPSPARVAATVLRVIRDPHPAPVVRVGSWFQARFAPAAARWLPRRMVEWMIRRYYGLS